jgi:hypothetical protein
MDPSKYAKTESPKRINMLRNVLSVKC